MSNPFPFPKRLFKTLELVDIVPHKLPLCRSQNAAVLGYFLCLIGTSLPNSVILGKAICLVSNQGPSSQLLRVLGNCSNSFLWFLACDIPAVCWSLDTESRVQVMHLAFLTLDSNFASSVTQCFLSCICLASSCNNLKPVKFSLVQYIPSATACLCPMAKLQ